MLSFLGSKAGALIVAVALCAVFFGLSKWRHHTAAEGQNTLHPQRTKTSASQRKRAAALVDRAEEDANGRADDVRSARQQRGGGGEGYDEVGNLYHRRATPDVLSQTEGSSVSVVAQPSSSEALAAIPTLRIHGRRSETAKTVDSRPWHSLNELSPSSAHLSSLLDPSSTQTAKPPRPNRFVPFGRLIKAELVITLESTQDEMPLVGLITEPVYNNGRLVIPAGTELHSMARPDRIRDRIVSSTAWTLVFPREGKLPNGRQLVFQGIALDREDRDGNGLTWGLTDGSYGLKGRSINNGQTQQTLLLFAAEAIKAASSSMMDRQQTILGSEVESNARNAGLAGGQAVLSHVAEGIEKEIERNGVYIQVPAGKEFYVYPRQVIDPDRADIPDNIAKVE